MKPLTRRLYDTGQLGRTAWYLGHALAAARLTTPITDDLPGNLPDRKAYLDDLIALHRRDRDQIVAGRYVAPWALFERRKDALRLSTRFLADLGKINLRRMKKDGQEVFRDEAVANGRPRYYLQNFHYQTDGWLSEDSADLYDFQVDVLFNGATDAMRRQALLPIMDVIKEQRIANLTLLDVACGTGRFLRAIKQNVPRLPVIGLDLSGAYLAKSAELLKPWSWCSLIEGKAEELPFPDESVDVVTSVYLLHELPAKIRVNVAREMARVVKPNGWVIIVDSLQQGDHPPFDGLLKLFPLLYHEPYYRDYTATDLVALFEQTGLAVTQIDRAFMSKIMVFTKPG